MSDGRLVTGVAQRPVRHPTTWIRQLKLTNFRNYASAELTCGPGPVVLCGHNGAGKTNILEAVSLIAPGQGLRRAAYSDMTRASATDAGWSVSGVLMADGGDVTIGTGLAPTTAGQSAPRGRIVRIDGVTQRSSSVLADYVEMVWLTPALDGLFTGPTADRRRFLDRLTMCHAPQHGSNATTFERAMRQRNRLLDQGARPAAEFAGLEAIMARAGAAIAAARAATVASLSETIAARRREQGDSPFPWAQIALAGTLDAAAVSGASVDDLEADYVERLAVGRRKDQAAGRTLEGPHRTDLLVTHGPKSMPAKLCSTGEQKALLVGIVLAHADMLARRPEGGAPILLLDEIAAHLDQTRREALFAELLNLGSQAWMTGTDAAVFAPLGGHAKAYHVADATLTEHAL